MNQIILKYQISTENRIKNKLFLGTTEDLIYALCDVYGVSRIRKEGKR